MKKNLLAILIIFVMLSTYVTGCGKKPLGTDGTKESIESTDNELGDSASGESTGKTLNIYCWNDSFKDLFNEYYLPTGRLPEDVKVNWITVPSAENAYQNALDDALLSQENTPSEEKIDMFLVEADYALKYAQSDFTLDVKNDVGLTDDQMSQMYDFTKQIMTDENNAIKGVSPFASPGLFAYRRSIAKEILGTDDPIEVQEYINDWNKFNDVAEMSKEKGYTMLSGYDDAYRVFSNNVSSPWVDGNKIKIDDNLMTWVDQTKLFTDKGYNNKTSLWSDAWSADQGSLGKVFGFFYSTWGITFTLLENALDAAVADGGVQEIGNGAYGDYAITKGPESFYWGGTWLCAANGTDNVDEIKDIMEFFCTEKESMQNIAIETSDFANHIEAMEELAKDDYSNNFLSGQNPYEYFAESALNIDMKNVSIYDQGLNDSFMENMKDYFEGAIDKDTALQNFYRSAIEKYPELEQ